MQTVDLLIEKKGLSLQEISQQSGLTVDRVEAIASGRWLPSPEERSALARVLEVPVDQVEWGHFMNPRNVRYRQHGLRENF